MGQILTPRLLLGDLDLRLGYAYELRNIPLPTSWPVDLTDAELAELLGSQADWLVVTPRGATTPFRHSYAVVADCSRRAVMRFECRRDSRHGVRNEYGDYRLDLTNVSLPCMPFVSDRDDSHVVINAWLADRLRSSDLRGFSLHPAQIAEMPAAMDREPATQLPVLFQLSFDGVLPLARRHIEPAAADRCPCCGHGPIVCPDCGDYKNPCAACGNDWGVSHRLHQGTRDRRIRIEPEGFERPILDVRYWDGSDFMGSSNGGCITDRALQWFKKIGAGPFVVRPVGVNVFGATEAELLQLEGMRDSRPTDGPSPSHAR